MYKYRIFQGLILFILSSVSAASSMMHVEEEIVTSSVAQHGKAAYYLNNPHNLPADLKEDLPTKKVDKNKISQVEDMVNLSLFYYENAGKLADVFSPLPNERQDQYLKRISSKKHEQSIQEIISNKSKISGITLVKTDELKIMFVKNHDNMWKILKNKFKTPFELLVQAYTQSKEKNILSHFFNGAFREGCIAIRTTKLSNWMSKKLIRES